MAAIAWLSSADVPGLTRQQFSNRVMLPWRRQPAIIVLHSTEGFGYPSEATYKGGQSAPHFTIDVKNRTCRQHYPMTVAAWALRAVGVSTNTSGAIQIEIIGSCDPGNKIHPKVYQFDEGDLAYLGTLLLAISKACGIPLRTSVDWRPYPASYGTGARQRLSASQWSTYSGVLGHQHVPGGNSHGDPGDIDIDRLLTLAGNKGSDSNPAPLPEKDEVDMASIGDITKAVTAAVPSVGDFARAVWGYELQGYNEGEEWGAPPESIARRLRRAADRAGRAMILGRRNAADIAGLQAAVKALASSLDIDADRLEAIWQEAATAALSDVSITLTTESKED